MSPQNGANLRVLSGKKAQTKAPKIQRLVTPVVLQRKRQRMALKRRRAAKKREEAAAYTKLLAMVSGRGQGGGGDEDLLRNKSEINCASNLI